MNLNTRIQTPMMTRPQASKPQAQRVGNERDLSSVIENMSVEALKRMYDSFSYDILHANRPKGRLINPEDLSIIKANLDTVKRKLGPHLESHEERASNFISGMRTNFSRLELSS